MDIPQFTNMILAFFQVLFNPERCKLGITYHAYYAHHHPSNLSRFPKQDTISIAIILSTPAKFNPCWPRSTNLTVYLSTPANSIHTDQGRSSPTIVYLDLPTHLSTYLHQPTPSTLTKGNPVQSLYIQTCPVIYLPI